MASSSARSPAIQSDQFLHGRGNSKSVRIAVMAGSDKANSPSSPFFSFPVLSSPRFSNRPNEGSGGYRRMNRQSSTIKAWKKFLFESLPRRLRLTARTWSPLLGLIIILYFLVFWSTSDRRRTENRTVPIEKVKPGIRTAGPRRLNWWNSWWWESSEEHEDLIPRVDRNVLEKLRLLEIHFGADEDDETHSRYADYGQIPHHPGTPDEEASKRLMDSIPAVKNIPAFIRPDPLALLNGPKIRAKALDAQTCPERNGQPCAFLIPGFIGEQETKAQLHLYQLGLLALSLNRTLVLPNVARSRLGTCFKKPFSLYYPSDTLTAFGIPTITQNDFFAWADSRDEVPTGQIISITGGKAPYMKGAIEIDSASDPSLVPDKKNRKFCGLTERSRVRCDFSSYSPLAIHPPREFHKSQSNRLSFGESLITTLRSRDVNSKSSRASSDPLAKIELPDVLALNYEVRYAILEPATVVDTTPWVRAPLPFAHFEYASLWDELAGQVAENLSPFIAIHWRTETLAAKNLLPCGSALIRKLQLLKQLNPEITSVYLATDYPIESLLNEGAQEIAHSGTYAKLVTSAHHAAIRNFINHFRRELKGLRLTTFAIELELMDLPQNFTEKLAAIDVQVPVVIPTPVLLSKDSTKEVTEEEEELDEAARLLLQTPVTPKLSVENLDSGLIGIIDKSVSTKAEIFLAGFSDKGPAVKVYQCAKASSYTEQIVDIRIAQRLKQSVAAAEAAAVIEEEDDEDASIKAIDLDEQSPNKRKGTLWNDVSLWALKDGLTNHWHKQAEEGF